MFKKIIFLFTILLLGFNTMIFADQLTVNPDDTAKAQAILIEPSQNYLESYSRRVGKYVEAIQNHWSLNQLDQNHLSDLVYYNNYNLDQLSYCLTDLNNDGDLELSICTNTYLGPTILDFYVGHANNLFQLFKVDNQDTIINISQNNKLVERHPKTNQVVHLADNSGEFVFEFGTLFSPGYYYTEDPNVFSSFNTGAATPVSEQWVYDRLAQYPTKTDGYRPITAFKMPASIPEGEGLIYRMYNTITGEHLYTPSSGEAKSLSLGDWDYEGVAWNSPGTGDGVFRLYNPGIADHLYTTDPNEVNVLTTQAGWQADNNGQPLFFSGGEVPVFRLYNPDSRRHHLTKDENEYNVLPQYGWSQEGIKLSCLS